HTRSSPPRSSTSAPTPSARRKTSWRRAASRCARSPRRMKAEGGRTMEEGRWRSHAPRPTLYAPRSPTMSGADEAIPGWQRLLERPRRLHQLATSGLLLAALVAGTNAFVRGQQAGVAADTRNLTYVFDLFVWIVVLVAACAEGFVAGQSAARARPDG